MIFFTADTHFGHSRILDIRSYLSVEEMDQAIIAAWNATVGKRDTIYHLGDVMFRPMDLSVLNGRKVLIKGNHDYRRLKQLEPYFVEMHDIKELRYNRQKYLLCHYPMLSWPSRHYGSLHLHGHSHGTIGADRGVLRFDVGFDVHQRPISIEEIDQFAEASR